MPRFVYKNPSTALIEYASAPQAALAQRSLQDLPLHGNPLKLNVSKFPGISIDPRNTPDMAQDFSALRNHRTRFGPSVPRSVPIPCNVVHATGFPVAHNEANVSVRSAFHRARTRARARRSISTHTHPGAVL